jgi:hypothetical protein
MRGLVHASVDTQCESDRGAGKWPLYRFPATPDLATRTVKEATVCGSPSLPTGR